MTGAFASDATGAAVSDAIAALKDSNIFDFFCMYSSPGSTMVQLGGEIVHLFDPEFN